MASKIFVSAMLVTITACFPLNAAAGWKHDRSTSTGREAVIADSSRSADHSAGREDGTAETVDQSRLRTVASLGSVGWPAIREHIWKTSFVEVTLFEVYGYSYPGNEDGSAMNMHVMIDRDVWGSMPANDRDAVLNEAREAFGRHLEVFDLDGALTFVHSGR